MFWSFAPASPHGLGGRVFRLVPSEAIVAAGEGPSNDAICRGLKVFTLFLYFLVAGFLSAMVSTHVDSFIWMGLEDT